MTEQLILRELHTLPEPMKVEVLHFILFLKQEQVKEIIPKKPKKERQFGLAKGKIHLAPDFDAPLEDFKEYMQ